MLLRENFQEDWIAQDISTSDHKTRIIWCIQMEIVTFIQTQFIYTFSIICKRGHIHLNQLDAQITCFTTDLESQPTI